MFQTTNQKNVCVFYMNGSGMGFKVPSFFFGFVQWLKPFSPHGLSNDFPMSHDFPTKALYTSEAGHFAWECAKCGIGKNYVRII